VIDLVAEYGITAYNKRFIAVALEMGIRCVTEDRELQEKFPGIAISIDEFLNPNLSKGLVSGLDVRLNGVGRAI
jgi:hypothetical protein